jgi:protein-L-isoaspartate(D-aspartate) O-methyltransferase
MDQEAGGSDVRWAEARHRMVSEQLERRGIRDARVLDAMRRVPRHLFVRAEQAGSAYEDHALPIGEGQTISQPYMVAVMTAALAPPAGGRVLEIGTGSGYQAAVLAELAGEVVTIERHEDLAEKASRRLVALGYRHVRVIVGDGSVGYAEAAPYAGILVTAGAPRVPATLQSQLADGARLVVPVGSSLGQEVLIVTRSGTGFSTTVGDRCVFVPLIGTEGWPQPRP